MTASVVPWKPAASDVPVTPVDVDAGLLAAATSVHASSDTEHMATLINNQRE
jgi:hypothetical protein